MTHGYNWLAIVLNCGYLNISAYAKCECQNLKQQNKLEADMKTLCIRRMFCASKKAFGETLRPCFDKAEALTQRITQPCPKTDPQQNIDAASY